MTMRPLGTHSDDGGCPLPRPPAPTPAPPPATGDAKGEAAPGSPLPGPPPFAGMALLPDAHDLELRVIGDIVRRIEALSGRETRARVAAYVAARFLP